jgi:hypothetical protein
MRLRLGYPRADRQRQESVLETNETAFIGGVLANRGGHSGAGRGGSRQGEAGWRDGGWRTYGRGDVVVGGCGGDEADEEAALADGGVPDEEDLEGAVVAAGPRRGAHGVANRGRGGAREGECGRVGGVEILLEKRREEKREGEEARRRRRE